MQAKHMLLGALAVALLASASAHAAQSLTLKPMVLRDPATGNQPAIRLVVPAGWASEGGVLWRPEMSNVATIDLRAWNPEGGESLEVMPIEPFVWSNGGIPNVTVGSVFLGSRVLPVISDPAAFIEELAPQLRPRLRHAEVVERIALPRAARAVEQGTSTLGRTLRARAARVRFEYREAGVVMQEDVYCALLFAESRTAPATVYWSPERLYSFRARKGHLERAAPLLHTILSSVRYDPVWFNRYFRARLFWGQTRLKPLHNPAELTRYLSALSDEATPAATQAYRRKLSADARALRGFGGYVRGLQLYRNPIDPHEVQLPAGYSQAWESASGSYFLSQNPTVSPRGAGATVWEQLERVQ
ncbi:MAG TPA: hypothetical protein VMH32_23185 [Burkholderiales bacterium]|nr:hypothetical protein [Burkholderiales bacterium]